MNNGKRVTHWFVASIDQWGQERTHRGFDTKQECEKHIAMLKKGRFYNGQDYFPKKETYTEYCF